MNQIYDIDNACNGNRTQNFNDILKYNHFLIVHILS